MLRGTGASELSPIAAVDGSATSYVDDEVDPARSYRYAVVAWNGVFASDASATDCAGTAPSPLLSLIGECAGL